MIFYVILKCIIIDVDTKLFKINSALMNPVSSVDIVMISYMIIFFRIAAQSSQKSLHARQPSRQRSQMGMAGRWS
jgi:hypothetical protein